MSTIYSKAYLLTKVLTASKREVILYLYEGALSFIERAIQCRKDGDDEAAGVEIYPAGLLRMIRRVWERYELPIIVTENGVSDATGRLRADFLRGHAYAVARAIEDGIPVQGYFHWSLLDNYEWAEGFGPRFGLYTVDFETYARTANPGAAEFARLARLLAAE